MDAAPTYKTNTTAKCAIATIAILVLFYVWFHRTPYIDWELVAASDNYLLSPAYGTISRILYSGDRVLVTIFLSPLDIHQQFYPCRGRVLSHTYDATGQFKIATDAYKSDQNEKMIHVMEDARGGIVVITQIAGLVVRRIHAPDRTGQRVAQGEYLGIIRLGSRVDIEFSRKDYMLLPGVEVGLVLSGPHTKLARRTH